MVLTERRHLFGEVGPEAPEEAAIGQQVEGGVVAHGAEGEGVEAGHVAHGGPLPVGSHGHGCPAGSVGPARVQSAWRRGPKPGEGRG